MAGVYRPRHPERTVLYRVLFHHFDRFLAEYECRFARINLHVHLHFLVTEGGVNAGGVFHKIPRIDDERLAEIFAREVLAMLVRKELLSPEWAERILSWPHSGFNVHSLVRARTKAEAELRRLPAKGWAAMIRKVYEVDSAICPRCGGRTKVGAFLTEHAVVDRILDHLKLTFVAAKPPPSHVFTEVARPEAEETGDNY